MVEDVKRRQGGKEDETDGEEHTVTGRRAYLTGVAGFFGTTAALAGSGLARAASLSNVLTIHGDRGFAEYEFTVSGALEKSTDMGATIDDHDIIDGSTATGHVWGGKDSYRFSGEFSAFELSALATVYVNGVEVDPSFLTSDLENVVTIHGNLGFARYEFAVSGALEKSTDMGATIDDHDTLDGQTATGHVWGGKDSYRFSGEISQFELQDPATVYVNGVEVDPSFLGGDLPHVLTIHGDQGFARYEFSVSGSLEKSTDGGATIDDHDTLDGQTATGHVWGGKDSYRFDGSVTNFRFTNGMATLSLDGEEVTPEELVEKEEEEEEEEEEQPAETVEFVFASRKESYTAYALEVSATGRPEPVSDADEARLHAGETVNVTELGDGRYLIEGEVRTPRDASAPHGDTFRWETEDDAWGVLGFDYSGASESDLTITIDGTAVSPSELPAGTVDAAVNIGGGEGYLRTVTQSDASAVVSTARGLRNALSAASWGDVVYVDGSAWITLSNTVRVPNGVTLASDRGIDGASGGVIEMSGEWWPLVRAGDNARVTGLEIRGPHRRWIHPYDESRLALGVDASGDSVEIDNCEISGFSWAGVRATTRSTVHHNTIHTCPMAGLGYGVVTHAGHPTVEYNHFNYTRHAIASTGNHHGYDFRYNVVGPDTLGHVIDVHSPGGVAFEIVGNTVQAALYHDDATASWYPSGQPALQVGVGGSPDDEVYVARNWFYNPYGPGDSPPSSGDAALWFEDWSRATVTGNHYGETEARLGVGHPR